MAKDSTLYSYRSDMNSASGVTFQSARQTSKSNLPLDLFLRLLSLEMKVEKQITATSMNSLITLLSQLVEHYNFKGDPIHLYFLERIKNYLAKTQCFKLYFTDKHQGDVDSYIHRSSTSGSKQPVYHEGGRSSRGGSGGTASFIVSSFISMLNNNLAAKNN